MPSPTSQEELVAGLRYLARTLRADEMDENDEDAALCDAGAQAIETSSSALAGIVSAVRAYLPPDGISKEVLISRVIAAIDSPVVNPFIERLTSAPAGWRKIETAPKMRGVLLWADTSTEDFPNWRMGSGFYHTGMDCWIWEGEQVRDWAHPPTHWQPLPQAPTGDQP